MQSNYDSWKSGTTRSAEVWHFWRPDKDMTPKQSAALVGKKTPETLVCIPCGLLGSVHKIQWQVSHGTAQLRNHPKALHKTLYEKVNAHKKPQKPDQELVPKKEVVSLFRSKASKLTSGTAKLTFGPSGRTQIFSNDHPTQKQWIHNQILSFAKSYEPLSIVENENFIRRELQLCPSLRIPGRTEFRTKLIPEFVATLRFRIQYDINRALVVVITYDLWMTYGTVNVFAINIHILKTWSDKESGPPPVPWERICHTLGLVQVDSAGRGTTVGKDVARSACQVINRFPGLREKILGDLSDEGGNLETMRKDVDNLYACRAFPSIVIRLVGQCQMHGHGGGIKRCLGPEVFLGTGYTAQGLHNKASSTLTWPRKSEPARVVFTNRCEIHTLADKLTPPACPTRPTTKILLYIGLIKYRPVIDDLYNPAYNPLLAHETKQGALTKNGKQRKKRSDRRLTPVEWDILEAITAAAAPVVTQFYENQSSGYYTISDAIVANIRICVIRPPSHPPAAPSTADIIRTRCSNALVEHTTSMMPWLLKFDTARAQYVLALLLDPRFKAATVIGQFWHAVSGLSQEQALAGSVAIRLEYDEVLLDMMLDTAHRLQPESTPAPGPAAVPEPRNVFEQFVEVVEESVRDRCVKELARFRALKTASVEMIDQHPMIWWARHRLEFPLLSEVATAIFTFPGSQNDVERVFSIAGYLNSLRRNRMDITMLDMLVFINLNYPNGGEGEFDLTWEDCKLIENAEQLEMR